MPELRRDPIVGTWVVVATERARRPSDYRIDHAVTVNGGACPFCPGHEERTPPSVLQLPPVAGQPGAAAAPWSVRVFPNKFPALMVEGDLDRSGDGLYDRMNGIGAHEVIVETPDHARQLHELSEAEIGSVIAAWQARIVDLKKDSRFRYVIVFKNHGALAGVSIEHTHSQLIALPAVPKTVADEMAGAREHYARKERCIYCDIVRQELSQRDRIVHDNQDFLVVAPWASRFPFETWILPRRHRAAFEDITPSEQQGLANALRSALRKLDRALGDPPYNFAIHTAPFGESGAPHYHWHLEIVPALARPAGFEMGSGYFINATPPEEAARFLRELPAT